MRLCTQVSCWIRELTFGQSKSSNHFLGNSFGVISLPLLPPLCFHMCLHNLVEHFPWPITIRRGKENPVLTPHPPNPRGRMWRKRGWDANINDFNAYYYCYDCSVFHIIMPLSFLFFFFLFALKATIFC